jgi:hypothetical protein
MALWLPPSSVLARESGLVAENRRLRPRGLVRLDWTNPLTRGLIYAMDIENQLDLVTVLGFSTRAASLTRATTVYRSGVQQSYANLSPSAKAVLVGYSQMVVGDIFSTSSSIIDYGRMHATNYTSGPRFLFGSNIQQAWSKQNSTARVLNFNFPAFWLNSKVIIAVVDCVGDTGACWVNGVELPLASKTGSVQDSCSHIGWYRSFHTDTSQSPVSNFDCTWNRILSTEEVSALSRNPYQILIRANDDPYLISAGAAVAPGVPTSLLNQNLAATSFRSAWTAPA